MTRTGPVDLAFSIEDEVEPMDLGTSPDHKRYKRSLSPAPSRKGGMRHSAPLRHPRDLSDRELLEREQASSYDEKEPEIRDAFKLARTHRQLPGRLKERPVARLT
jgi:hypothetical protein